LLPKATKFDSSSGRDFFEDLSFLLSNEHRSNEAGNFGFQAIIHHQGGNKLGEARLPCPPRQPGLFLRERFFSAMQNLFPK
jgi:hypothetical protein